MSIERLGDYQRTRIFDLQSSQLRTQAIQSQPSEPPDDDDDDDAVVFTKSSSSSSAQGSAAQLAPNYTRPKPSATPQSQTDTPLSSSDGAGAILNATIAGGTAVQASHEQSPEDQTEAVTPKEGGTVQQGEDDAAPQTDQGESQTRPSGTDTGTELNVTA